MYLDIFGFHTVNLLVFFVFDVAVVCGLFDVSPFFVEKHQTDRIQQHSHPPSNKIKTQHTEKTRPTTPPHHSHTEHKMARLKQN